MRFDQVGDCFDKRPTAVYNADKKVLVDVFPSRVEAGTFIYGLAVNRHKSTNIAVYVATKTRICKSAHPFKIAVRNATPEQIETYLANNQPKT